MLVCKKSVFTNHVYIARKLQIFSGCYVYDMIQGFRFSVWFMQVSKARADTGSGAVKMERPGAAAIGRLCITAKNSYLGQARPNGLH